MEESKNTAQTATDVYTLLGKCLCVFGVHNFKYYKEEMKCSGLPHIHKLDIPVRECKRCGIRQHHLMPKCNGYYYNWKPYLHKQGQILHFKEI